MFVPAADPSTALVAACASDRDRIVCRYSADGFELLLAKHNLTFAHPYLSHNLRHGFPLARNPPIPLPSISFLPPNHKSASDTPAHRQFVVDYLRAEECLGHVSAAFPLSVLEEVYGPIRSSPLGVVDKATPEGAPQKFRLITDASFPDSSGVSINSLIKSDDFPTRWDGAIEVAQMVSLHSISLQSLATMVHGVLALLMAFTASVAASAFLVSSAARSVSAFPPTFAASTAFVYIYTLRRAIYILLWLCCGHRPAFYVTSAASTVPAIALCGSSCARHQCLCMCSLLYQIRDAPRGTLLAVGDISACFRNNPWQVRDKSMTAIRDVEHPDLFRIDHTVFFGATSGPGIAGEVNDAIVDILGASGIPSSKWVDDFLFRNVPLPADQHPVRFPSLTSTTLHFAVPTLPPITSTSPLASSLALLPVQHSPHDPLPQGTTHITFSYAYILRDVRQVTDHLAVPWANDKWQGFSFLVEYLGFIWDCWNKRVSLPDKKRLKYHARVLALLALDRTQLRPLQKVYGCLQHVTFVIRQGRSHLPSLQRAINGFDNNTHRLRQLPSAAGSDLEWWAAALLSDGHFCSLQPDFPVLVRNISVDASKSYGIGLREDDKYRAWKWKRGALGLGGRDIGGAEAIALEFALRYLVEDGVRNRRVRVRGDNTSTIGAFNRGRGRNVWTNLSVRRAWELQDTYGVELDVEYVRSAENPSDVVSRGVFDGLSRLDSAFALPDELVPFLTAV